MDVKIHVYLLYVYIYIYIHDILPVVKAWLEASKNLFLGALIETQSLEDSEIVTDEILTKFLFIFCVSPWRETQSIVIQIVDLGSQFLSS